MTENQTPTPEAPANLAAARKEQAAAKKRHPAGSKTPAKAPAKKAPAKAPAKKVVAERPASLRWTFPNGRDEFKDGKTQIAPFGQGELAILKAGDGWKAVYREKGKKEQLLAEGAFGKCYNACTKHAKGVAA